MKVSAEADDFNYIVQNASKARDEDVYWNKTGHL